MAIFQVHPHFGYLNSDILLVNRGAVSIVAKDNASGQEYKIPASSNVNVRLNAGVHKFTVVDNADCTETVTIEDAIKLGGSKEKASFVFEGTPWVLMVMLDRTYFFNRETSEQYVELGLVPQDVRFLTADYLLFISDKDNSLLSLRDLAIEKTIGDSSLLFSNEHYAVFSTTGGVALYSLDYTTNEKAKVIACDDYTVDEIRHILYFHNKEERVIHIKDLSNSEAVVTTYKLKERFRCFVGNRSVVYGRRPDHLYIKDLHSKEEAELYNGPIPVSQINEKIIWENDSALRIYEAECMASFATDVELTVHQRGARWLVIRRVKYILKDDGTIIHKYQNDLRLTDSDVIYIESNQPLSLTSGRSFDCVCGDKNRCILVFDKSTSEISGEPIVSPHGYIIIANKDENGDRQFLDPKTPSFCQSVVGYDATSLLKNYGLIKETVNSDNQDNSVITRYRNVDSGHTCKSYDILSLPGFFKFWLNNREYMHSPTGIIRIMPCSKDRLLAISEKCNFALVKNEDGEKLVTYHEGLNIWLPVSSVAIEIDRSFYAKAVFCADGNNIVYQKEGTEFYLRNINSEEEAIFEPQGSVMRRNINGYIPYLDVDSHRRPVFVDPVTLTRVDYMAAGQFSFKSIDEQIQHVDFNFTKYYDNENARYITAQDYALFKQEYDYEHLSFLGPHIYKEVGSQYEKVIKNRKLYYEKHKAWLSANGYKEEDHFVKDGAAIDRLIKKEYFVRENVNGVIVDIPLPMELKFLNYVSYSYDNRFIAIAGRFPQDCQYKGLVLVYDVEKQSIVYQSTNTKAVWLSAFSKNGAMAYYDSTPCSWLWKESDENWVNNTINGRSFLTFSPSGKYMALSRQGYIPYSEDNSHWGHQPSKDVYIVRSNDTTTELAHYCDHGDQIEGSSALDWDRSNESVASATFSADEGKLMTVSKDGVVVIRNLHFNEIDNTGD